MLPASRNKTFSDDTPVDAGTLNDLQDAIISRKHGQLSLVLWGSAFSGKDIVYDESVGYLVNTAAGIRYAQAVIPVPAGTRVASVEFWYNPAGFSVAITPSVRQKRLSTGAQIFEWSGTGDTTGSAIESQTVTPNHTIVDGDALVATFLFATNTPGSPRGYGAKVTFDKP